jgi:conjugative transfer region lipoprotein (TIGR03751 family)
MSLMIEETMLNWIKQMIDPADNDERNKDSRTVLGSSIAWFVLLGCLALLSGCATGSKDSMLPQEGPTMKQVYQRHFSGGQQSMSEADLQTRRQRSASDPTAYDLKEYTRDANNEIERRFPKLKNPTLVLYVFPHLSGQDRNPVPGYATAFTLYEKTEFALPGEVEAGY